MNGNKTDADKFAASFGACLYHVPFVKMAQKAHQRLTETDAGKAFEKDSEEAKATQKDFSSRVAPWLDLNARIGNIYTGALFLSLASLLETSAGKLNGKPVSLFSYGSGSGAEFTSIKVNSKAQELMKAQDSEAILNKRKPLTVSAYEIILDECAKMDLNNGEVCKPEKWGLTKPFLYLGTKDNRRVYSANGQVVIS